MKKYILKICSVLLCLAMVAVLLPAPQQAKAKTQELSQQAYTEADSVFAQIDAMEEQPAHRNAGQTQLTDAAAELVMASDSYVEGSLDRNGDAFTWWTDDGIRCIYSPRMRQIREDMTAPAVRQDFIENEPVATKGGSPSGNQVYVIGPYYGMDSDFTDQYKKEARRIANAIGDTDGYTLYSGTAATVDKVAEAVANGAVVIFDSHGTTDYESGYDYVSGAEYSYLCLSSTDGLTSADYAAGAGYDGAGAFVNGAAIANHMTKNSPGGMVWMALCLGMATDTLCAPMRQKGVEVVYGYSQSVTFAGDYLYEETFWQKMLQGNTVADSVAEMKAQWGKWDWSIEIASYYGYDYGEYAGYATIDEARADYCAFPIVVSDEDAHPGQRYKNSFYGACSLQDVKSTYFLNIVANPDDFELHYVDTPVAGTPYKLMMDQNNVGKQLGFAGEMNGYYYATTEEQEDMVDVYLESVSGGYRMYFLDGTVKTYLNIIPRSGTTSTNVVLQTLAQNANPSVYQLNTQYRYIKTTVDGNDWYLGSYQNHYNISSSNTSYISDVSKIGVSQFPAWFATTGSQNTPSVPDQPDTPVVPDEPDTPVVPDDPDVPQGEPSATYVFADYQISGELGGGEFERQLDATVYAYISGGWFNTEARIYQGKYMGIYSERPMTSIVLNAGYKTSTFDVYVSENGEDWRLHKADISYVSSYSDITIELPENCQYLLLDAPNAQLRLKYMTVNFAVTDVELPDETAVVGDLDGNEEVDEDDVIYLLRYMLMPEDFQVTQNVDYDQNGGVDEDDVIYLLQHLLMPEDFPLT